jgi:hypothetical protein
MKPTVVRPDFLIEVPPALRKLWKLVPGSKLQFVQGNGSVRVMPYLSPSALRGIARGVEPSVLQEPDREL